MAINSKTLLDEIQSLAPQVESLKDQPPSFRRDRSLKDLFKKLQKLDKEAKETAQWKERRGDTDTGDLIIVAQTISDLAEEMKTMLGSESKGMDLPSEEGVFTQFYDDIKGDIGSSSDNALGIYNPTTALASQDGGNMARAVRSDDHYDVYGKVTSKALKHFVSDPLKQTGQKTWSSIRGGIGRAPSEHDLTRLGTSSRSSMHNIRGESGTATTRVFSNNNSIIKNYSRQAIDNISSNNAILENHIDDYARNNGMEVVSIESNSSTILAQRIGDAVTNALQYLFSWFEDDKDTKDKGGLFSRDKNERKEDKKLKRQSYSLLDTIKDKGVTFYKAFKKYSVQIYDFFKNVIRVLHQQQPLGWFKKAVGTVVGTIIGKGSILWNPFKIIGDVFQGFKWRMDEWAGKNATMLKETQDMKTKLVERLDKIYAVLENDIIDGIHGNGQASANNENRGLLGRLGDFLTGGGGIGKAIAQALKNPYVIGGIAALAASLIGLGVFKWKWNRNEKTVKGRYENEQTLKAVNRYDSAKALSSGIADRSKAGQWIGDKITGEEGSRTGKVLGTALALNPVSASADILKGAMVRTATTLAGTADNLSGAERGKRDHNEYQDMLFEHHIGQHLRKKKLDLNAAQRALMMSGKLKKEHLTPEQLKAIEKGGGSFDEYAAVQQAHRYQTDKDLAAKKKWQFWKKDQYTDIDSARHYAHLTDEEIQNFGKQQQPSDNAVLDKAKKAAEEATETAKQVAKSAAQTAQVGLAAAADTATKVAHEAKQFIEEKTPEVLDQAKGFVECVSDLLSKSVEKVSESGFLGGLISSPKMPAASSPQTAKPTSGVDQTPKTSKASTQFSGNAGSGGQTPLMDLIGKGEADSYITVNDGSPTGGHIDDLTKITVGEVIARQEAGKFGAAGKHQFIRTTLKDAIKAGIVKASDVFDKNTQDKLFAWRALANKSVRNFLSGKSDDVKAAGNGLATIWAAVGVSTDTVRKEKDGTVVPIKEGESYYKGVGNNKARLSPLDTQQSLYKTKEIIQSLVASGMSEEEAMTAALSGQYRLQSSSTAINTGISNNIRRGKGVDLERMNPLVMSRANGVADDLYNLTGKKLMHVNEGYRTLEEQQRLWKVYQNGGNTAAIPGTSPHGYGLALDVNHWEIVKALSDPKILKELGAKDGEDAFDIVLKRNGMWRNLRDHRNKRTGKFDERHHIEAIHDDEFNATVDMNKVAMARKNKESGKYPGSAFLKPSQKSDVRTFAIEKAVEQQRADSRRPIIMQQPTPSEAISQPNQPEIVSSASSRGNMDAGPGDSMWKFWFSGFALGC